MICRMWKGWTACANADAYEDYLRNELFPRVAAELGSRGYNGHHVLRLERQGETEFVTMVWFTSLDAVRGFAGDDYEVPVISPKAQRLLSRYAERCDHYELRAANPSPGSPS
jgi:heme-degrading monooxygenase HmoA